MRVAGSTCKSAVMLSQPSTGPRAQRLCPVLSRFVKAVRPAMALRGQPRSGPIYTLLVPSVPSAAELGFQPTFVMQPLTQKGLRGRNGATVCGRGKKGSCRMPFAVCPSVAPSDPPLGKEGKKGKRSRHDQRGRREENKTKKVKGSERCSFKSTRCAAAAQCGNIGIAPSVS